MNTKIVILIQILFFSTAFSQETTAENRRWQLGIFYSSDYTSSSFIGSYGYNTGVNVLREINSRFRMDAGLHFSSVGNRKENLTFGSSFNPSSGAFDTTFTLRQKNQFIELPVKLNFILTRKEKFKFYLVAGVSPNYFLRTLSTYDAYPPSGEKIKNYSHRNFADQSFVLSGIVGIGFEIKMADRVALHIQPSYRYYFISDGLGAIGLNGGITFKL